MLPERGAVTRDDEVVYVAGFGEFYIEMFQPHPLDPRIRLLYDLENSNWTRGPRFASRVIPGPPATNRSKSYCIEFLEVRQCLPKWCLVDSHTLTINQYPREKNIHILGLD